MQPPGRSPQPPAWRSGASFDDLWTPGEFIASPRDAEHMATRHLRSLGHSTARTTPTGPDGGVDVIADDALAQVKMEAVQTGRPAVQQLVGAAGRRFAGSLYFYSAAGYTQQAIDYAESEHVSLFTFDVRGTVTPVASVSQPKTLGGQCSRDAPPSPHEENQFRLLHAQREYDSFHKGLLAHYRQTGAVATAKERRENELRFLEFTAASVESILLRLGHKVFVHAPITRAEFVSGEGLASDGATALVVAVCSGDHRDMELGLYWLADRKRQAQSNGTSDTTVTNTEVAFVFSGLIDKSNLVLAQGYDIPVIYVSPGATPEAWPLAGNTQVMLKGAAEHGLILDYKPYIHGDFLA